MRKLPRFFLNHQLAGFAVAVCLAAMPVRAFAATLAASPRQINYGSAPVNSGPYTNVTLTNRGRSSVRIYRVGITSAFKFEGISTPLTLSTGGSVTFQVKFVPKTAGSFNGTLTVSSNAPRVAVTLSGTGVAGGSLTLNPTSLSFGNVTVGSTSTKTASLTAGTSTVSVSGASTTNPEFTLSGLTLPATIAAGQSLPVNVNFSPKSSGAASAQISVASSATNPSVVLLASGSGVALSQHRVSLSWAPGSAAVAGYNIYRGTTTGGPYAKLNGSSVVGTFFADDTVQSGKTYFYVATSLNSAGTESAKSSEVRAVIPTP